MILAFGGTTEGRKTVEVLEEAGTTYYYSTKTGEQEVAFHHGIRIDGALDRQAMETFCRKHGVRLIVDAAHPFAIRLHQTIAETASRLSLPVIRYERIYPARDADICWMDGYADLLSIDLSGIHTLLATTGVQSITHLKPLEARGIRVSYRILPRESSVRLARQQGAADEQLCYYHEGEDERTVLDQLRPDAILLKESGRSGGFIGKVEAARALGVRILALKRPEMPASFISVNGSYGLRRTVEHLLPEFFPLHSGLTTGTCATAAAVAATLYLLRGKKPAEVPVILPDDETIHVPIGYGPDYAYCIKDGGDDPDVTDGLEIRAHVSAPSRVSDPALDDTPQPAITITGGEGVGTFTLPGFDFPPGSPAINKGPREMMRRNLAPFGISLQVTISVPQGAETARRTFNPRLGIEGGISIIGVSGIVKPFSEEAFISSIRKCMQVAKASATDRVVINSGGKSERFVRQLYPDLPRQAFVEYGNYIGETLRMADELQMPNVTLGVMLGKAVKLAEGQLDTHSRKGTMNKDFISQMLTESGIAIDLAPITLARELWQLIPEEQLSAFARTVIAHCASHCRPLLPKGTLTILLLDDEGNIYTP